MPSDDTRTAALSGTAVIEPTSSEPVRPPIASTSPDTARLSGGFVAPAIDQQLTLWSIDSWLQTVDQPGTSSGFPLFAELNVDNDHFYEIWVWCGVDSSPAGMGTFWGSGADSFLSITIPSVTWELC